MAGTSLFVYGTLTSDDVRTMLTGRRFPFSAVLLEGYARVFPRALGGYPTLVPRPGEAVSGLLLEDVDAASLRALDAYEDAGHLYRRQPVEVVARGVRIACEAYVAVEDTPGVTPR